MGHAVDAHASVVLDVDAIIPPAWKTGSKTVFPLHAFVSHTRNDLCADQLRDALARAGLRVWHDGHQNLADRRVSQKVQLALRNSRTVLVCVSQAFNDSAWCRAEYLAAIRVGRRALARRVIAVVMHPDAHVPVTLVGMPRVDAYRADELAALSRWLEEANQLPIELADPASPIRAEGDEGALTFATARLAQQELADAADIRNALITCLAHLAFDDVATFSRRLFAARSTFILDKREFGDMSEDEIGLTKYVTSRFSRSPDEDNRANALMMLCALEELTRRADVHRLLIAVIEREERSAVIRMFLPWAARRGLAVWGDAARAVFAGALRSPQSLADYPALVALLPEVLRAWVFTEGLSKDVLPVLEQLKLLSERLDYALSGSADERDAVPEVVVPPVFGISTVETICRELTDIILPNLHQPRDFGTERPKIYAACLDILSRVVATSEERKGGAIGEMQDWVHLCLLQPLLVCSMDPQLSERARQLYFRSCDVLARSVDDPRDVATCRRAWERFAADPSFPNDYFVI